SRLATFAQAMSHTMSATPEIHVATRAVWDSFGPRSLRMDATTACGRASATGGMRGSFSACAAYSCRYARLRSAFAAASVTPGLRSAIMDAQNQWYVVHHSSPGIWSVAPFSPPRTVIGMNAAGGLSGQTP